MGSDKLLADIAKFPPPYAGLLTQLVVEIDEVIGERQQLRTNLRDLEQRAEKAEARVECESCGGQAHPENDLCGGCKRIICLACVAVFGHWGNEAHESGDPEETVRQLRADLERVTKELVGLRGKMSGSARDAIASLIHEAAVLVRREHSQEDDDAIDRQGVSGIAVKKAADLLRARVAELEAEVERLDRLHSERVEAHKEAEEDLVAARERIAEWEDPDSPKRQALLEETVFNLGEGNRSEVELREGQLELAEARIKELEGEIASYEGPVQRIKHLEAADE